MKKVFRTHVRVGRAWLHACVWRALPSFFFFASGLKADCCVRRHHDNDMLSNSLHGSVLCALAFYFFRAVALRQTGVSDG